MYTGMRNTTTLFDNYIQTQWSDVYPIMGKLDGDNHIICSSFLHNFYCIHTTWVKCAGHGLSVGQCQ